MPGDVFWRLSLRELWTHRRAWIKQREREHDRDMIHAWHVAAITLGGIGGKLTRLETLLSRNRTKGPERVTPAQMRSQLDLLSKHLGIPLRPSTRKQQAPTRTDG